MRFPIRFLSTSENIAEVDSILAGWDAPDAKIDCVGSALRGFRTCSKTCMLQIGFVHCCLHCSMTYGPVEIYRPTAPPCIELLRIVVIQTDVCLRPTYDARIAASIHTQNVGVIDFVS
jgi:hypothetical protein